MRILLRGMIALLCVTLVACGAALIFLDDIVDAVIQDKLPPDRGEAWARADLWLGGAERL